MLNLKRLARLVHVDGLSPGFQVHSGLSHLVQGRGVFKRTNEIQTHV
jgi:hypothetical protein